MSIQLDAEEDFKSSIHSNTSLKLDNELFDEVLAKKGLPVFSVKNYFDSKSNKIVGWEVWKDKTLLLKLPKYRFSKKEKHFLASPPGMLFLLQQVKDGIYSISSILKNIKNIKN